MDDDEFGEKFDRMFWRIFTIVLALVLIAFTVGIWAVVKIVNHFT